MESGWNGMNGSRTNAGGMGLVEWFSYANRLLCCEKSTRIYELKSKYAWLCAFRGLGDRIGRKGFSPFTPPQLLQAATFCPT